MKKQLISNSQRFKSSNKFSAQHTSSSKQKATISPVISVFLITAITFGFFGYFIGHNILGSKQANLTEQNEISSLNISNISLISLENLIDKNRNVWKKYGDEILSFNYPIYLSDFRDLSADTDLAKNDEQIAGYYRSSIGSSVGGRSYWIILKDVQPNTKGMDVEEWIIKNKLNILKDDSGNTEELLVEKMTLGGSDAYRINFFSNSGTPRRVFVYFQTLLGIRAIGFQSWSSGETLAEDYNIYTQILETMKYGNFNN